MPELPDLQVFAANLTKKLKGKKLHGITINEKKKIHTPETKFNEVLVGKPLKGVHRRGKQLYFDFGKDAEVAVHLMLHGKLVLSQDEKETPRHTIAGFTFGDSTLFVTDFQKMATISLNPAPQPGMDALAEDVTSEWVKQTLASSKASIKALLMDQKVIAGIGNAYADEILYVAGIAPQSKANKIPAGAAAKLAKAIKHVLVSAEKKISKDHEGIISGEYRDFMAVHHTDKETSPDGEKILIKKIGGRSTYFTQSQELFE
jgi:formamidopyrimidine-DNA glycosylase